MDIAPQTNSTPSVSPKWGGLLSYGLISACIASFISIFLFLVAQASFNQVSELNKTLAHDLSSPIIMLTYTLWWSAGAFILFGTICSASWFLLLRVDPTTIPWKRSIIINSIQWFALAFLLLKAASTIPDEWKQLMASSWAAFFFVFAFQIAPAIAGAAIVIVMFWRNRLRATRSPAPPPTEIEQATQIPLPQKNFLSRTTALLGFILFAPIFVIASVIALSGSILFVYGLITGKFDEGISHLIIFGWTYFAYGVASATGVPAIGLAMYLFRSKGPLVSAGDRNKRALLIGSPIIVGLGLIVWFMQPPTNTQKEADAYQDKKVIACFKIPDGGTYNAVSNTVKHIPNREVAPVVDLGYYSNYAERHDDVLGIKLSPSSRKDAEEDVKIIRQNYLDKISIIGIYNKNAIPPHMCGIK
ncbi:MAG TPA: hypothetical protein VF272_00890 [Candidatus Saccharimonadia bacterium]